MTEGKIPKPRDNAAIERMLDERRVRERHEIKNSTIAGKPGGQTGGHLAGFQDDPDNKTNIIKPVEKDQSLMFNQEGVQSNFERIQSINEYLAARVLQRILPGRASKVSLMVNGMEVQKQKNSKGKQMNVSELYSDDSESHVNTRSEFLEDFSDLYSLFTKGVDGVKGYAAWNSVKGFEDVLAASLFIADYDIHSGNLGIIKRPKLDKDGAIVSKDGTKLDPNDPDLKTKAEYELVACKIDHGFAFTDSKAHNPLHNLLAKDSFAKMPTKLTMSDVYDRMRQKDYIGQTGDMRIPFDHLKFKKSIDNILAKYSLEEADRDLGASTYELNRIMKSQGRDAAGLQEQSDNIKKCFHERYNAMKALSAELGRMPEVQEALKKEQAEARKLAEQKKPPANVAKEVEGIKQEMKSFIKAKKVFKLGAKILKFPVNLLKKKDHAKYQAME